MSIPKEYDIMSCNADDLVNELTYSSYRMHREQHPEMPADKLVKTFDNKQWLEERYQKELKEKNN